MQVITNANSNRNDQGDAPRLARAQPFKLLRYFSVASLLGMVLVTVCLIWIDRAHELRSLVDHESRAHADLTRAFANTVWARHRGFVLGSSGRSKEALLADPAMAQLQADVQNTMRGLQVAKIKIYNLDGLTVFSTDARQVGEDKSANQGFRHARDGGVDSQITYREKFDAFEGVINNRNLIASYIPVRNVPDAAPEGVFEVYSDVTELLHRQNQSQWQMFATVLATLAGLYLFLYFVVRKADRTITRQYQEQETQAQEVRHQASHDVLTGLPNRKYFSERLDQSISAARHYGHPCALMFIDLDRFKCVNDSLGHDAGDILLKIISQRIHSCLRGDDLLFRMGGDEFTVILTTAGETEAADLVAKRILAAVGNPVSIQEHELLIGASIGIAVFPGDGDNPETLLKNADAAMYSVKKNGQSAYAYFHTVMNQGALQRLNFEVALQKGFRDDEFTLYYQPRLNASTRRVVALEALLRWISPSRGLVPPNEFIGVLESTGMMNAVGEWVLRSACAQICRWQQQPGWVPLRVSVNVSAVQFQNDTFVAMVEAVLRDTGVPPGLIEFELTESLLIHDPERANATIQALKALGIRIALDDFGTGYSSLNYLRHFAVDYLKIDRSFVTEIATNARDRAVATAIIELARALNITVVAEGVETEAQATFFSDLQCGELQGFLFCKPLPVDQLQHYLRIEPVLLNQQRDLQSLWGSAPNGALASD